MTLLQRKYNDQQELIAGLSGAVASLLARAIKQNGRAGMAVSGGATPKPFFDHLSTMEVDWGKVVVTLVDERWVDVMDKDSNERLVRNHLLQNRAAVATFIGLKNNAPTATAGEDRCERRLQQVPHPFDLVILGMGNDGHTASLFPGSKQLARATAPDLGRISMAVSPPAADHERMTLTLPAILASRQIFLHIVGRAKIEALRAALTDGKEEDMPIRFILKQPDVPVTVFQAP